MNDEINGARDVTKSNTYRVEAFRSGELGFLGYVDPDQVVFYRASTKRHTAQSEFDLARNQGAAARRHRVFVHRARHEP